MSDPFQWNRKNTLNLIGIYKRYTVLWHPKHPDYKNKVERQHAFAEIARHLNIDQSEIERKIKNLSSHYLREIKREKESELNGRADFKSKWFAVKAMAFLSKRPINYRNKIGTSSPRASCDDMSEFSMQFQIDGEDDEVSLNSVEIITDEADQPEPTYECTEEKKIKIEDPLLESIEESGSLEGASSSHKCCRDESTTFGEYIASKIRPMNKRTKAIVEYEINSIIFRADMGCYNDKKYDDIKKFD